MLARMPASALLAVVASRDFSMAMRSLGLATLVAAQALELAQSLMDCPTTGWRTHWSSIHRHLLLGYSDPEPAVARTALVGAGWTGAAEVKG